MLFHSFEFLMLFGVTLLGQFYIPSNQVRLIFLLVISYTFYLWYSPLNGVYIFASTILAYATAIGIYNTEKKRYLVLNLACNFLMLFFFKSFDIAFPFWKTLFPTIQHQDFSLPLGLSFYTFQAISYTMDVSRKELVPEKNFIAFSLYHSFFPQIIAGPIERAGDLLPQLKAKPQFNYYLFRQGLLIFVFGFMKKRIIADRVAYIGETTLNNWQNQSSLSLIFAGYCIVFQYYCDFSAYSEMALGTAQMMGINLKKNFNFPFLSASPIEFWRRWHITLMSWLHDYIYRPIMSLDFSFSNMLAATMIVFIFAGLWHGLSLNFLIWGILNGAAVLLNILFRKFFKRKLPFFLKPLQIFYTFHLFVFNGVFLFFSSSSEAAQVLSKMLSLKSLSLDSLKIDISIYDLYIAGVAVTLLMFGEIFFSKYSFWTIYKKMPAFMRWLMYFAIILALILYPYAKSRSYVYFKF